MTRGIREVFVARRDSIVFSFSFILSFFPQDFLKSFFNSLYDEEVISEDAFFAWEKDTDPSEVQGKGTAKSSTAQFFDWLRSAEEEKTDEG